MSPHARVLDSFRSRRPTARLGALALAGALVACTLAWSAPASAYWIRGRVTVDHEPVPARVWITNYGSQFPSEFRDCDENGDFAIYRSNDWWGKIQPEYDGYGVISTDPPHYPHRRYPTPLTGDLYNQDFIVTSPSYTLDGYVKDAGVPVSGATVSAIPFAPRTQAPTTTTDASGHYSLTVLIDWQGTVRATKSCYTVANVTVSGFLRGPRTLADLTIAPILPTVTLVAPNGGEEYTSGKKIPISWSYAGSMCPIASQTLEYSDNGGSSWQSLVNLNGSARSHLWTAPNSYSSAYRVRIIGRSTGSTTTTDASNASFRVVPVVIDEASMVASSEVTPPGLLGHPLVFQFDNVSNVMASQVRYKPHGQTQWIDLGWCWPGMNEWCPVAWPATRIQRRWTHPEECGYLKLTWQARVNTNAYGFTPWTDVKGAEIYCLEPPARAPERNTDQGATITAPFFASPSPNPASVECALSFGVPERAGFELAVFDLRGARLRTLAREAGGGSRSLRWDLRDEHGARVPKGIYWVRLLSEGNAMTHTVLVQ